VVGSRGLGLRISARGNFLALGYGASRASLSIYQVSSTNFALTPLGTEDLGNEQSPTGIDQMFPSSIFFDPTGQVAYVRVPLAGASNCANCFELLDTSTFLVLPSSPIARHQCKFLEWTAKPASSLYLCSEPGKRGFRNQRV